MLKTVQGNARAAITVLVLITILFIGMYVTIRPFALLYDYNYASVNALSSRAGDLMVRARYYWLSAAIIFAVGLLIWLVSMSLRRDPIWFQK